MGGGDDPVVRLDGAQMGDPTFEQLAQTITNHGADVNRVLSMMELLIKNAWDDQQQRDTRQHEVDFHREMTRQRLERIAADVAAARRWLIGLTLALAVVGAIVVAVVADRFGAMALALLVATLAARMGR